MSDDSTYDEIDDDEDPDVATWAEGENTRVLKFLAEKDKESNICDPLKADIYQMAALGVEGTWITCSTCMTCGTGFDDAVKILALWTIPFIQLLGPLAIMVWAIYSMDWSNVEISAPFQYMKGSDSNGVSRVFLTALSFLLLFLFCLYSFSSASSDDENLLKIRLLCWTTQDGSHNDSWLLNYIGPFINVWIMVMSCIDMLLIFFLAESPKDVVFDALGLLFLFNLDDIPGQVDALLPYWPAGTAGHVYWYRVNSAWADSGFGFEDLDHNTDFGVADPDYAYEHVSEINDYCGIGGNIFYYFGRCLLRPLIVVLPVSYLLLNESLGPKTQS